MKLPMPWLVATLLAALGSQAANATWKANSITDPLTKEKHPYMSSAGQGAIRQLGHTVTSRLVILCARPPEEGVPYLLVDLWFSEDVTVGAVQTRFRFDNGLVHARELDASGDNSRNQFTLLRRGSDELDEFETSKKLRIQVSLPWAGDTVIEFDTSGASDALNRMPCEER